MTDLVYTDKKGAIEMEIYTNGKDRDIYLEVPVVSIDDTISVEIYEGSSLVYTFNTATYEDDRYKITMPFSLVQSEKVLRVVWKFEYEENNQLFKLESETTVNVFTPLLTEREILEIHPNATPAEVRKIEVAVRNVIYAFTGQTFGKYVGSFLVRGSGDKAMKLPRRVISVASVDGYKDFNYDVDIDGGYIYRAKYADVPTVKADNDGFHQHVGGVIHNPNGVNSGIWHSGKTYNLNGVWGWASVPAEVKEAAALLVNDYACADNAYRDRYLTSMTAADWRIQFNALAWVGTGNARADQLLSDYVIKRSWSII